MSISTCETNSGKCSAANAGGPQTRIAVAVTGAAQLVTLVATKTPQLVTMAYRVSDADRAYARAIYPRVQDAMRAGVVHAQPRQQFVQP
jgi:hypothetical protein